MNDVIQRIEYRSGLESFSGETRITVLHDGTASTSFSRGTEFSEFHGRITTEERTLLFSLAMDVMGVVLSPEEKLPPDASPTTLKITTADHVYEWTFSANRKFREKKILALVRELEKTSAVISKGEIRF